MNRMRFFSTLLFATLTIVSFAKRKTIDGVQYENREDNTAVAILTIQAKGELTVKESVEIGGLRYLVVEISEAYFKKNDKITSVKLPKSLKIIRGGAFRGCSKLTSLVLPAGGYTIEEGAFAGSDNINSIDGNVVPYLEYRSMSGSSDVSSQLKKPNTPRFSTFAENTLKARMQLWQTKKNYESVEQYKNRVTEENRLKRMHEFEEDLKKEYTALYKPSTVVTSLGPYDSEYEVFTITTVFYGDLYAKVPKTDAMEFRINYNKVEVLPEFGVKNDTLSIASCQFKLGNKTYGNMANYEGAGGADYKFDLPPLDINLAAAEDKKQPTKGAVDNSVDKNIPKNKQDNKYTFALIIGNEKYENEAQVPYANNDAKVFAEYCKKTLGIPDENVKLYTNAGLNRMRYGVTSLVNTLKAYDGEAKAIVYYAGHGIPDESSKMPYLLPADGFAKNIKTGYSMTEFYDELASAPSQATLVFLDACFSGSLRGEGMLTAARSVAIEVKKENPEGNMVVFSASKGDETAYPYAEKGHGLFTYFLLKKLQETSGNVDYGTLSDFIRKEVGRRAITVNNKPQTPTVVYSPAMSDNWRELKLR